MKLAAARRVPGGAQLAATMGAAQPRAYALIGTATVAFVVGVVGCGGTNADFPPPPRTAPVNSLVLVSANGRVLTARGAIACGHRPVLVARSYPDRVTLTWVNPDTSCDAEAIRQVTVSTSLSTPLGSRALVQASTGTQIRHRDAPQPRWGPPIGAQR